MSEMDLCFVDEERYARQIVMPETGIEGQKKLASSSVLVIGAGGLGSPVLLYLAGAGVGTLGIADADEVSVTNLPRQILHTEENIGKNKALSAKEALLRINSDINIKTYPYFVTPGNISGIIKDYDFIIDAVDNFETKFLINDACVLACKPFCYAGVIRFNGQVMTYVPGRGPCLRCVFSEIPESSSIPKCAQAGVMGAACGLTGCVQALEAVKYITGAGKLLTGAMFVFDALKLQVRIAAFPNSTKSCRVCGPNADIKDVRKNTLEYTSK